ncbi:MAG: Tm-1-like ATP-binding domain-containing protein [Planctomycetes bacterium]|nr:Tm-1-like ATP-binding domain-containing protein [Planctomycetota bacterium]
MTIILLGTLDTKGVEYQFVRDLLKAQGLETLVIDAGVIGPPHLTPDITRDQIFAAAGTTLDAVVKANDRGQAVELAAKGAAKLVADLHAQGKVDGILGLGGSAGTTIATAAMRALPFGLPKLMVSTLASGQVKSFVGVRDIMMMHSVVDISGINRITRVVLTNAANAMAGMAPFLPSPLVGEGLGVRGGSMPNTLTPNPSPGGRGEKGDKPLIAATMFGVTTPCVEAARKQIECAGYEVLVFHATGTGGMTMESFIKDGMIEGVLDITTTELADELVGGILSAGKDRLTAAAIRGVPQVVSVGALDMVNFGPRDTVPEKFQDRKFYIHNSNVTLMRTTPAENDRLGKEIAEKASAATGPTALLLPLRGVSAIDRDGQPFWWPEADQALFQSIRNWVGPQVKVIELDLHINDPEFARIAAETLLAMVRA